MKGFEEFADNVSKKIYNDEFKYVDKFEYLNYVYKARLEGDVQREFADFISQDKSIYPVDILNFYLTRDIPVKLKYRLIKSNRKCGLLKTTKFNIKFFIHYIRIKYELIKYNKQSKLPLIDFSKHIIEHEDGRQMNTYYINLFRIKKSLFAMFNHDFTLKPVFTNKDGVKCIDWFKVVIGIISNK